MQPVYFLLRFLQEKQKRFSEKKEKDVSFYIFFVQVFNKGSRRQRFASGRDSRSRYHRPDNWRKVYLQLRKWSLWKLPKIDTSILPRCNLTPRIRYLLDRWSFLRGKHRQRQVYLRRSQDRQGRMFQPIRQSPLHIVDLRRCRYLRRNPSNYRIFPSKMLYSCPY